MRPSYLRHLLLASICALGGPGCNPIAGEATATGEVFAPELLRQDLAFLQDAVVRRHPRFHDQAPDAEFQRAFAEVDRSLREPMTREQAFRAMALVNPVFKDAHTLLLPTFTTDAGSVGGKPFPIAVRLGADNELRVEGDWIRKGGGDRLASGTVIRAINGEATTRLLDDLSRYGHGETKALRRHMLTVMFADWLAAVRGWRGAFRLQLERDGQLRSLVLGSPDEWQPAQAQGTADRPSLHDLGEGVALLRLPTFDVDEDPGAYRAAVDDAFAKLRRSGAVALIVDVRGNTGGQSEAGAQVIRYLANRPVNQVSRARERLHEDNRGLLGYKGRVGEMREMDLSRDGLVQPAPAAERFDGKVVLLVDAMTYSAAILFATTLQDHGLAVLAGQPTGGYANQTGNMEPVRLPNTGLTAYIPARVFVRPNGDLRAAAVVPDLALEADGRGEDAWIQVAIDHLHSRRTPARQAR